uniref:Uncharacterized protein n=1 Tax=Anguilla anguilla TaxID=7936 RepID=A0A0E9SM87_ANGAN
MRRIWCVSCFPLPFPLKGLVVLAVHSVRLTH